jgi:metal-dependent amidase/aminoacylase/carboxypeptidase family protein
MQPTHRVHGIIQGKDWAMNVIPGTCDLLYNIRAPNVTELEALIPRVINCFKAAALATGCKVEIKQQPLYKDVANNSSLAKSYQSLMHQKYDRQVGDMTFYASTGESLYLICG